jgi:hypothetical protein
VVRNGLAREGWWLTASGSSNSSNAVGQMSLSADTNYNQAQIQQIADKLDELISVLRR